MMLWLVLTIMTWAAAMWLAVPFVRRFGRPHDEAASDIAVYRDQLQEVERDVRDGRIDDAQAEAARTEIKRRILAAGETPQAVRTGLSGQERGFALVASTGILVLGSVMLYAVTGSPELAATGTVPFLSPFGGDGRAGAPREATALPANHPALEGLASADVMRPSGSGDEETPSSPAGLPTVEEMTRRLAARLARNPEDVDGWRTLGWSYLNIGRFADAADAYAKAIALDPGNAEFRSARIDALVGAADGTVTAEAKAAIGEALKLDPKDVRARYFDGLALEQAGDKAGALAAWSELLNEGGADENYKDSWASELRTRVSALKREMGLDGRAVPDLPRLAAGRPGAQGALPPPDASGKGPGVRDMQAAEAMAPADRTAMIRGMVDGLASRLERSPRDADGWIRLIRSRIVLGESELARQALARGLAAFADDAPEHDRIATAAAQLGVRQ
jgi:cytochrome c-type biogenesis protein CcmH